MSFDFYEFSALMIANFVALISPGPDFMLIVSQAIRYGRRIGWYSALGIASAIWLHIAYSILGIAALLYTYPAAMHGVQLIGAVYLAYLAWALFKNAHRPLLTNMTHKAASLPTFKQAYLKGFLTNALNPKATIFFLTIFSVVVKPETGALTRAFYGLCISLLVLLWFSTVTLFLSQERLRRRFLAIRPIFDRLCAFFLALFALRLLWMDG